MAATRTVIRCPAKVNLALSVGGPDASGFHPMASWMVAVDLVDTLELERRPGPAEFRIEFDAAEGSPGRGQAVDWPLERDLSVRAWRSMSARVGRELEVGVRLLKRIPAGGGLGGGSADAGGMLVALNGLFGLGLGGEALGELAASLGSDVPFGVLTAGGSCASAVATGRGERLEPMSLRAPIHLVLVFPSFGCPTAKVYAALDELRGRGVGGGTPEVDRVRGLAQGLGWTGEALFNDLAVAAERVEPRLADMRRRLARAAGRAAHVTGSGSTLFVLAADGGEAVGLATEVEQAMGVRAAAVRTIGQA